jgi:hypothetical protein
MGIVVMTAIITSTLNPVTLKLIRRFRASMLRVTRVMDNPIEMASLSMIFICLPLKKISVQAKPGRKNTSNTPKIALTAGKLSRKGRKDSKASLTGESHSNPYVSSPEIQGYSLAQGSIFHPTLPGR